MDPEVLNIAVRLIRACQKQAEEQALLTAKWRNKLGALEGELLRLADKEVTSETATLTMKDLMK